jgi:AraC-like DNA-binding protein
MQFLLFAEALIILLFAGAQLTLKGRRALQVNMAVACVGLAYNLLYAWAVAANLHSYPSIFVCSDIAATFVTAPAFFLASRAILLGDEAPRPGYAIYYIAPAIGAVATLLYAAITVPGLSPGTGAALHFFPDEGLANLRILSIVAIIAAIAADLETARRRRGAGNPGKRGEFRSQVLFLFAYLLAALILLAGALLRHYELIIFANMTFGFIALCFVLIHTTVSYLGRGKPIGSRPVATKPEWEDSDAELAARLSHIMDSVAPYRDSALTLGSLATLVRVEPRQLSYHIHAKHGLTFRGYINELRLDAVCRLFDQFPARSILDAAFECGFNSKSSFNTLFHLRYGQTPREYKNHLAKRKGDGSSAGVDEPGDGRPKGVSRRRLPAARRKRS